MGGAGFVQKHDLALLTCNRLGKLYPLELWVMQVQCVEKCRQYNVI